MDARVKPAHDEVRLVRVPDTIAAGAWSPDRLHYLREAAPRDALADRQRAAAAQAIAKRGLPLAIKSGAVVAGYSPIRNEIDPAPIMQSLAAKGARLALPVVPARGKSLIFRAWTANDRLM